MEKVFKYLFRIIYIIILLAGVTVALYSHTKFLTKPAIASYNTFTRPSPKVTSRFDLQYRSRFYPDPKNYLHRTTVSWYQRYRHLISRNRRLIQKSVVYVGPRYQFQSARHDDIMYLKPNYPIWRQPYRPGVKYTSSTNGLANNHQAVELYQKAQSRHHTFYQVISGGYTYGWVSRSALIHPQIYQMPFHYYSQLQPFYAPDACEAVSLRMALSVKGHNPRLSMEKFIDRIPRSKSPNKGYTHSPYRYGDSAAIYPKALARYARRYNRHSYAYTGISRKHLIYELKHGNPIVFEGSYRMKDIDSDHTLVLVGYSHGDLKFADPYYERGWPKPISWVSIRKFTHLFHQSLRGARAVVIK